MNLRKIRLNRDLSVPQLVEVSGVPRRTIQDIEKRGDCKLSIAIKLAAALNISMDELTRVQNDNISEMKNTFELTCSCGRKIAVDSLDDEDPSDIKLKKFIYEENASIDFECVCGNKATITLY